MFRPGEIIDARYRVIRNIGAGGFGSVYLAEELDRGEILGMPDDEAVVLRRVALKVLDRRCQPRRFGAEVRALCRLSHPCIVTVYGWGMAAPPAVIAEAAAQTGWPDTGLAHKPYLTMEYVAGETLAVHCYERRAASHAELLGWMIHIADALAHAHERHVIHRDLKPANVVIAEDGLPRIVDFGLSWLARDDDDQSMHVGTPGFMAPELFSSDDAPRDQRADLYSFGATLFSAFAGRPPFESLDQHRAMALQLDPAGPTFPPGFPSAVRDIVERCLQRDPARRPPSAAAVAELLRRVAQAPRVLTEGAEAQPSDTRVELRDLTVRSTETFTHPSRGGGIKFELRRPGTADAPPLRGFAYRTASGRGDAATSRAYEAIAAAWPGAELSLYGAALVANSAGERFLSLDAQTLPVLEPYFPVTVTDVAKADGNRSAPCATRVLVDMRRARDLGPDLVTGSIAHAMLERLVVDATLSFEALFDASLAEFRIDALAAGMNDAHIDGVRAELRVHFGYLSYWTQPDADTRRGFVAEARRVSGRYGLDGRMDLSLADGRSFRILELKTGRTQRPEHHRQLLLYTLLWDALAAREGRDVSGWLLYSKTGRVQPLARGAHTADRTLAAARNDVVAMHRWFSDGDTVARPPTFGEFPNRCDDDPCRYRRDECKRQCALLGDASGARALAAPVDRAHWGDAPADVVALARAYYFHFVRLIEREHRAASQAMGDVYRRESLDRRVDRQRAVPDASLVEVDAASRTLRLACDARGVFDAGDLVVVHRGDFDEEPALFGKVVATMPGALVVACGAADFARQLPRDGWVVDEDVLRVGFGTMHRALFEVVDGGNLTRLRVLLTPQRVAAERRVVADALDVDESDGLNDDQRRAVAAALRDEPVLLVQGPPGTGKTTVIAEVVRRLVAVGKRVLLAACTHTAVNNALARIVALGVDGVVRVGSGDVAAGPLEHALRGRGLDPAEHVSGHLAARAPSLEVLRRRLLDARVYAATTNACGGDAVFAFLRRETAAGRSPFDVVVVDEASQLTEPLSLAAINLGDRFILVGDEQQLPPVVIAADALSAHVGAAGGALGAAGVTGLERSLFARLKPFAPHVMLRTQYRMSEGVQQLPNMAFYAQRLVASPDAAGRRLPIAPSALDGLSPELRRRLDPALASVWVPTSTPGTRRAHADEAQAVAETVAALVQVLGAADAFHDDAIGVVSAFRAQCHAIRQRIEAAVGVEAAARVEVDTVERFQGREKDVMLISLVATEWSDFVMNHHRLNVAMTRARSKTIVFGSRDVGARLVDWVRAVSQGG